jgi:hypothetical protein
MFRRRPNVMRPFVQGNAARIPLMLQHANELMTNSNYAEAAETFKELAQIAFARNGPRAPIFFMQAGRALVLSGQTGTGVEHIKRGLSILSSRGEWQRFQRAGNRTVKELTQRGLTVEAKGIEEFLKSTLPAGFIAAPPAKKSAQKPVLPTNCPSCGAMMRPDEIEWLDDVTAECAYCGSPVRGEN